MTRALKNLKNLHFNGLILTKVYNVSAKKVQRSYVWLHSRLIQSLKENWLVLPKIDMRNLANFHQSIWKSPNWNIDGILFSSWKCTSLNFTCELCVMAMKNDAKIEEELTRQFKIDMRNLTNFDPSTWKSQKCEL